MTEEIRVSEYLNDVPDLKTRRALQELFEYVIGVASAPEDLDSEIPHLSIHTTSDDITGNIYSGIISQTMTAAASTSQIEVLKVILTSNVKTGAWANAIYGKIDYSTSGAAHGMAAAACFEMVPPNSSLTRGALYALDLEFGCGASSEWGSAGPVAFIKMANWGTTTHFSANAFLFHLYGETAAADALVSATKQTAKCLIGDTDVAGMTRYMVLSQMQDGLGLGNSTTSMDLGTSTTQRAIDVYTTSASVSGSTSIRPIYMKSVMTGAGGVGGRAEFYMTTAVRLGGWANALKGYVECTGTGASCGGSTGLISAVCAEIKLPSGTCRGAYFPLEVEYVDQTNTSLVPWGSSAGFMYLGASGTVTDFDDDGVFMQVVGLTAGATHLLSAASQTLKCYIGGSGVGSTKYLVLSAAEDCLSLAGSPTAAIIVGGTPTTGISFVGDAAYNPIHIGTKANTATGGLNMNGQDSYDNHGGIMMFCDDGGVALATTYTTSAIWTRYLITTSQTSNTHTGAYLQMKSLAATYTSCDTSAAKIYFETADAVTLASGHLAVLTVSLGLGGAFTDTAEGLSGINLDINDGGDALSTAKNSAGIRIREGGTAGWPIGLYIEDGGATTGIKIGNCTTGINLDGTFTTGINMVGGVSYNPIHIGVKSNSADAGLILTGATDDTGGMMIFADDGGDALGSVTSPIWTRYLLTTNQGAGGPTATGMFAQLKSNTGLTFATGAYTAFKAYYQVGGTLVLNGANTEAGIINAGVTFEGDLTVTNGTFSGIDVNINDGANTIGTTSGLLVRKTSGSTAGWTYGLNIADSGAVTGINIGTCTTGINISGTTTNAIRVIDDAKIAWGTSADIQVSWTGQELLFEDSRTIDTGDGYNRTIHVGNTVTMADSRYAAISNYTTLAGSGGKDAYGAKFAIQNPTTNAVDGHYGAIMGEVKNASTGTCISSALFLRWDNDAATGFGATQHSFIRVQDNSSQTHCGNLFDLYEMDATTGASATEIVCQAGAATAASHVIKIVANGIPYWILMDSTPPA